MIDFVKIQPTNMDLQKLLKNPLLEFNMNYNEKTHELSTNKKTAEYKGLKFIITNEKYIEIQGSLHKYKNNGIHNYDRFGYLQLKEVLKELVEKFEIDLDCLKLQNLEVGLNIIPPIETKKILKNLLHHKSKPFKDPPVKGGNYRQIMHQRYFVKCYDKSLQFKLPHQLLRFELKFIKMIDLNRMGIIHLSDLLDNGNLKKLKNLLVSEWNEIFLFDSTCDLARLSNHIKVVKANQWNNPNYWLELTKQGKNKQLKQYNKIIEMHSQRIHQKISKILTDEFDLLLFEKGLPINRL